MKMRDSLTKFFFYTQSGNNLINAFRTLIEAIAIVYFALHVTNWILLPLMFVVAVPILAAVGWYFINFMNPVMDKISTVQGSYAIKEQLRLLESINKKLDNLK